MNSSKFKNTGNFATSASLAGLVMAIHFAGLQLLFADTGTAAAYVQDDAPVVEATAVAPKTIDIEPNPNTEKKLSDLLNNIEKYKTNVVIKTKQGFNFNVKQLLITTNGFAQQHCFLPLQIFLFQFR